MEEDVNSEIKKDTKSIEPDLANIHVGNNPQINANFWSKKRSYISIAIFLVIGLIILYFYFIQGSLYKNQSNQSIQSSSPTLAESFSTPVLTPYIAPSPSTLLISPSSSPNSNQTKCLSAYADLPRYLAKGIIKVLVIPVYFDDVKSELEYHNQREQIYKDAFDEIQLYLATKQKMLIGKTEMLAVFDLANPLTSSISPTNFESTYAKSKKSMQPLIPNINLSNYQIVVIRALTHQSTNSSGDNWGDSIWMNQSWSDDYPIPESISLIANNDQHALHIYRGMFTSLMLHEILHSLGMADKEGARENVFYMGTKYTGLEELSHKELGSDLRDVNDQIGIFQDIGDNVAKEIGWSDRNSNGIIDVEEMCVYYL